GGTEPAGRALRRQVPRRVDDVPAAAVAHRHLQPERLVAGGALLGRLHARLQAHREALLVADEAQPHAVLVQLVHLAVEGLDEQPHQRPHLLAGPPPVLAAEREQRQRADAPAHALADRHAHRLDALAVAGLARQSARAGPAAVAVHDDGDVTRQRHGGRQGPGRTMPQTCITSFSLAAVIWSMSATALSVIFWISSAPRRSSSCEISFSFSASLISPSASRRTLRTATLAFSASARTTFRMSRRRSSVSGGSGMRITVPAVLGFRCRSDLWMAFSMAETMFLSQGVTTSVRPSSTPMLATCESGMSEP